MVDRRQAGSLGYVKKPAKGKARRSSQKGTRPRAGPPRVRAPSPPEVGPLEAAGRLAGGVAHDFNNLLTIVKSCSDALAREPLPPESAELVREIAEAARRGAQLTRQLLAFSRRDPRTVSDVDLRGLVTGAFEGAPARPPPPPRPPQAGGAEARTLLLAEDDLPVRALLRRFLEAEGYAVLEARDPDDALRLSARSPRIDALVTDVVMPGMNGKELARRLAQERPGLRVLFVSASAEEEQLDVGGLPPGRGFLAKPFDRSGLAAAVRQLLA